MNPIADFQFHVSQNSSGIDLDLDNYTVTNINTTIQHLVVTDNIDLAEGDIEVVCYVSNINGNDSATTHISLCGKYIIIFNAVCFDTITNNCINRYEILLYIYTNAKLQYSHNDNNIFWI